MPRTIVVAGATGLVGKECLRLAARDPGISGVYALVRRFVHPSAQPQRVEYRIIDFEHMENVSLPHPVDAVISALGTTMRTARSREAFRRVDFDYVLALARQGLAWGASHFLLVSAATSNPGSRIFYPRTKGEVEAAVRSLPYPSITIVRPSLLAGDRSEPRRFERLGLRFSRLLPARYRPVAAQQVAGALLTAVAQPQMGCRILENTELRATPLPSSSPRPDQVT
jgi:uncharacterized protein YbjT (DUF2867 family)